MFECGNLRFVFKHKRFGYYTTETIRRGMYTKVPKMHWSGRYNVLCEVYGEHSALPLYRAIAKLLPNDEPDPILGKKIALKGVMMHPDVHESYHTRFASKHVRTEIWTAFWQWVSSWKPTCEVCGSKDIRDGICVDCLVAKEKDFRAAIGEMRIDSNTSQPTK